MKILRISLRNIASLAGEHTVDFTRAPLVNTGLFSISGPTGSGKSTLLDALCLALFDDTPRMAVAVGTQAVTDAGAEVQQNDVRNLLRRGCGTGFAEVAFVGVDGETYTARWHIRRARESASGKLQKTQHLLLKGNVLPGQEGIVAESGTATEVRKAIVAKLGLSFDQFRRAVLLAQGDFATFLKARDNERAEILQALTGTERFENISKAVHLRNKREQELVQALSTQMGAAPPMSAEARAEADEELRKAVDLQKKTERELLARRKQLEWFQVEAGHRQKLEDASKEVSRLDAQVQANAPRERALGWIRLASIEAGPKRVAEKQAHSNLSEALKRVAALRQLDGPLVSALEGAEARHKAAKDALEGALARQQVIDVELAKARMLDGELAQIEKAAVLARREYADAQEVLKNADGSLAKLKAELDALAQDKQKLQQRVATVASFAPFARDLEVWLERFKAEQKARGKKDQVEKRVSDAETEVARATSRLEQASSVLQGVRERCAQAEKAWKDASEKAASFKPEEILSGRRNALDLQAALQKAQTHLADQKRLQRELAKCGKALSTQREQIAGENLRRAELSEKLIPEATVVLKQAQESLRLAEAAASEHAAILRDTLVQGEACPVCGSREHPHAGGEVATQNAVFKALKRDTGEKEKALQKLQAELAAAGARVEEKNSQCQTLAAELAQLTKQIEAADHYTPGLSEVADLLEKPASQRDAGLKSLEARTEEQLRTLDKTDEERTEAEKIQKTLRAAFDKAERDLHAAEKTEAEARNACAVANTEHANARLELDAIRTEHADALGALSPVVSELGRNGAEAQTGDAKGLRHDFAQDPEAFRGWFEGGAREHNAAVKLLEAAAQEEAGKLPQRGTLENAAATARGALETRRGKLDEVSRDLSEKQASRNALLGGRTVQTAEDETVAEVQSARSNESESAGACVEARNKLGTHQELLKDQQTRVAALESTARDQSAAMDEWLNTFVLREGRELERAELDDWLGRDAQWIGQEQKSLETAVNELASAQGMAEGMLRQLQEHLLVRTSEDEQESVQAGVDRLVGESKAAGESVDLLRAAVLSDEERIRKTGELSRQLEAQKKQAEPWGMLNELIGSADGTRFRNMAQQWTLEILLRHANAQLALLSGRYRLERLRDSLNLLVTDLEMDGQQRSVHSLSGGESFLVSLGLALGLASLTSSRLLIESLFIDEGFGSLDTETLRVALNALNHLESQGRKVGVISHVSEMVDAIPVQVRVVRGPGGASRIVV